MPPAKPKQTPAPTPPPPPETKPNIEEDDKLPRGAKAEAIRKALTALGNKAPTKDVAAYLNEHGFSVENDAALSAAVSTQRKRMGAGGLSSVIAVGSTNVVTAAHLLAVKEAADDFGDFDEFLATIERVTRLAEQVGGLDGLRTCVETLRKIMG